ncbi:LacI family DNA-binding transcriptional regulator [Cohaesibacter celericrescens]|uniref:LacI family transcriptional regulator n=1 Tax=Cohaesibacter celericrescens TaxID=2067669 RepID=A0A2N5XR78_9HYPH|nr:substrate-binding domain-containing protein [Cohaesibacter celericrescens]PLW76928.1 LacI family transcriptional regulator [Cohaesibacter celericrescens]
MNLKELSNILKLSQTTVSRALNGYPEVGEKTRLRVVEAAQKYNYHPSSSAKQLAMGRSHAVAHVVPQSPEHSMINPHFSDFIAGAGETYSRFGYDMLIPVVPFDEQENCYRELAKSGRVDGVIVHGPAKDDARIELLESLKIPFVVHGRTENGANRYSWLDVNNRSSFKRATNFLLDLGHTRIALLNGLEEMDFAFRRRIGYESAMVQHGLEVDRDLIFSADMIEPYGYEITRELLKRPNPPTAVLTSSVLTALGVVRAAQEAGLHLGRDLSVLTFDDQLSFLQYSGVPLFTAVRSSIKEAGKRLAEILLERIANPDSPPTQELWEAELVVGRSTGPRRIIE